MDILDNLLAYAQISGGVNVKCQLQGDWLLDNPHTSGQAVAHIVMKGQAHLIVENQSESRILQTGDIVFFSRSQGHCLSSIADPHSNSDFQAATPNLQQNGGFVINKIGNEHSDCEIFCLHFHYDKHAELMENLPEMMILNVAQKPVQNIVQMLKNEAENAHLATISVVNALAVVILTLILRDYLAQQNGEVFGTLKGFQEPRLRNLLKAIVQNPEQSWQIEEMAALAHLSRSQLIRLFNKHLEISPHAFVHKIRLQQAAMFLKQKSDSILNIALSTGFQSETHFSKAFKKMYGQTPSAYRQAV